MMKGIKKMVTRMVSAVSAMVIASMTAACIPANAAEELTYETTAKYIQEMAILVNEARVEAGLKPLYILPYLNEVAEIRAVESSEDFSHTRSSNGKSFASTIDLDEVPYSIALENLAGGYDDPAVTFEKWKESPGHWANIMNPDITHMGIGVVFEEGTTYEWYWQQTFVAVNAEYSDQYLPTTHEIVPESYGDINGDGVVDTFDYLSLSDYIYKRKTDYPVYFNNAQMEAADCFVDGFITEADAKVLARYILGEYKSLPFVF